MATMSAKNTSISALANDLTLGDDLANQVEETEEERRRRLGLQATQMTNPLVGSLLNMGSPGAGR